MPVSVPTGQAAQEEEKSKIRFHNLPNHRDTSTGTATTKQLHFDGHLGQPDDAVASFCKQDRTDDSRATCPMPTHSTTAPSMGWLQS